MILALTLAALTQDAVSDFRRSLDAAADDFAAIEAVKKIAAAEDPRVVTELASCLTQRGDVFRATAARALAERRNDRAAAEALAAAVSRQESDAVKIDLLRAFGETKCKAAAKRLIPHLSERRNVALETAALRAAREVGNDDLIEPLVLSLREIEMTPDAARHDACAKPALEALASITGQTFSTAAEYHAWWKARRAAAR